MSGSTMETTPAPLCEAERRILQAVFAIEIALGTGITDLGELKRILIGRNSEECESAHHAREGRPGTAV